MANNPYKDVWNSLHKEYAKNHRPKYDDWLDEFLPIIEKVNTKIIDLGCGVTANNTLYLLEKGKRVISCDFAEEALRVVEKIDGSETLLFDMLNDFPFEDDSTELIIADLCLHYFRTKDMDRIIKEIKRILRPNGYLFLRLNSVHSDECKKLIAGNAMQIEPNMFMSKNMEKKFFGKSDIEMLFKDFNILELREESMSRFYPDKIVWKCAVQNIK